MNKLEIEKIVNDEINKFVNDLLDKKIKEIIAKKSSATRGELVELTKDALESVYKMLWVKRDFWKTDIK